MLTIKHNIFNVFDDDNLLPELRRQVDTVLSGGFNAKPGWTLVQYLDAAAVDTIELGSSRYAAARGMLQHRLHTCEETYAIAEQYAGRSWILAELLEELCNKGINFIVQARNNALEYSNCSCLAA